MTATPLPPWMVDRLGWMLVHSLWQFSLWALVAMLLQRAMRRSSAAARYATCVLTLGLMPLSAMAAWTWLPTEPPAAQREALTAPTLAGALPVSRALGARKPGLTEPAPNPGVAGREASEARTPAGEPPEVTGLTSPASWWSSAEVTAAEFAKSSTVRLKPWGRVEGEFAISGKPVARRIVRVEVPPLADSKEPVDLGNLVFDSGAKSPPKPPAAPPPKPAKMDGSKKADAALRVQAEESEAPPGPLEIEWLKDLDVLAIRGPRPHVEQLTGVIQ